MFCRASISKTAKIVLAAIGLAAAQPALAQSSNLFGWTRNRDANGMIDFVKINELTGQASLLFKAPIPAGYEARDLTYDPSNGLFYGNLFNGGAGLLAEVDPIAQTITTIVYSGFPRPGFEGIEYLRGKGIVVSGADVTGIINALFVVDHSGAMVEAAYLPAIVDQDALAANSCGGELHVQDVNSPTGGFKINRWTNPFGASPTLTGVYNGPTTGAESDVAIDPVTVPDRMYTSLFNRLAYYTPTTQVIVGNFNYSGQIWGIAFRGPCPVCDTCCPADFNCDGVVDFFDYLDFVAAFDAGC